MTTTKQTLCAACGKPVPGTAGQPMIVSKETGMRFGLTLCKECAAVFTPEKKEG